MDVSELKRKISENKITDREKQLAYCDMLLSHALAENNKEEITAVYLWLAEYNYYVKRDMIGLDYYLNKAKQYLSTEPSRNIIQYYTLKAMNNDSTYDFLSRLDAYLEIIYNGKIINDELNVVTAIGNIAELFHLCHDYQTALSYSINVYEQYKNLCKARDINKTILLINIVESSCYVKDMEKAQHYIEELEKVPSSFAEYEIYLNLCYLRYYATKQIVEEALRIKQILVDLLKHIDVSRDTVYECFTIMIEAMLSIQAAQEMEELIERMESLFNESDMNRWLHIQKLRIEYYTLINNQSALAKQIQIYVKLYERVKKTNQETKIKGVRATLDIQKMKRQEELLLVDNRSLETDSYVDGMTKLFNRRYFNGLLNKLVQDETLQILGFAILDVDYFKEYNDTYGHLKGDQVLIKVGEILKNTTNERIHPCRFGGDEFTCIFVNMQEVEVEDYICNVIKQLTEVDIPHNSSKCENRVTLSIGFGVEHIYENFNHNQLFERIDQALYGSKRKGRNRVTKIRMAGGRRA